MDILLYRKIIYNSYLNTEYKGNYLAETTMSSVFRNQKIAEYKIKNETKEIKEIENKFFKGLTVIEINSEKEILEILKALEAYKDYNLFIILNMDNIPVKLIKSNLDIDILKTNNLSKSYEDQYNICQKEREYRSLDLKDITWEEYWIIKSFFTNEYPEDVYFEEDFKNRIYLSSIGDLSKLKNVSVKNHSINEITTYRFEPYDYVLENYKNKVEEVLSSIINIDLNELIGSDIYLIDLMNDIGFVPISHLEVNNDQ